MRLIILDTETTGSSIKKGDRCVEIGAVEMVDGSLTGATWHSYVNPCHPINFFAQKVHGLTTDFLQDKPLFEAIAGSLLAFANGSPCLAHNAKFDRDMLQVEFERAGLEALDLDFYDTIKFAKTIIKIDGYNLDNMTKHLGVRQGPRGLHGALEDAQLLGEAVAELERRKPGALSSWVRRENSLQRPEAPGAFTNETIVAGPKVNEDIDSILDQISPAAVDSRTERQARDMACKESEAGLEGHDHLTAARAIAAAVQAAQKDATTFQDFLDRLRKDGIVTRPQLTADSSMVSGFRFTRNGISVKGSPAGVNMNLFRSGQLAYRINTDRPAVLRAQDEHFRLFGDIRAFGQSQVEYRAIDLKPGRSSPSTLEPSGKRSLTRPKMIEHFGQAQYDEICKSATAAIGRSADLPDLRRHLFEAGLQLICKSGGSYELLRNGVRMRGYIFGLKDPIDFGQKPETMPAIMKSGDVRLAEGLNPGVAEQVSRLNATQGPIPEDLIFSLKSGRDAWSTQNPELMQELLEAAYSTDIVDDALSGLDDTRRKDALRWMCRGVEPERSTALMQAKINMFSRREPEMAPDF